MTHPPIKSLGLAIVFALFLAVILGHGAAVAAPPVSGDVLEVAHTAGGSNTHHRAPCDDDHCGVQTQTCCLMEQCLLGVPVAAGLSFRQPARLTPYAVVNMGVADAAPELPFRPPAPI